MWKRCASFLVLALLLGCRSSPSEPSGSLPFTTLVAATVSGSAGPQIHTVVRSDRAWAEVWSELWGDQEPARPAVDFSREMVVVVTASEICAGHAEVEEILFDGFELRVRYADAAPSLCLCFLPELRFHAVRLRRLGGLAVFEARQIPSRCGS